MESSSPDEPPGLTVDDWGRCTDANLLLAYALPRIPIQHACLVWTELLDGAYALWESVFPEDGRPAAFIAATRARCFDEATRTEVVAAHDNVLWAAHDALAAHLAKRRSRRGQLDSILVEHTPGPFVAYCAARGVAETGHWALWVDDDREPLDEPELSPADAHQKMLKQVDEIRYRIHLASLMADPAHAATEGEDLDPDPDDPGAMALHLAHQLAERRWAARTNEADCRLIRVLIPYPWRYSFEWHREGSWIRAGDALLRIDGWRVIEGLAAPRPPNWRR